MAGNSIPQIEDSNDANKQKESVQKGVARNGGLPFTGKSQKSTFYP